MFGWQRLSLCGLVVAGGAFGRRDLPCEGARPEIRESPRRRLDGEALGQSTVQFPTALGIPRGGHPEQGWECLVYLLEVAGNLLGDMPAGLGYRTEWTLHSQRRVAWCELALGW